MIVSLLLAAAAIQIPPAQLQGVYKGCERRSFPQRTCQCFIDRFSMTAKGRATLDVMGTVELTPTEAAMVKVAKRHGMTPRQLTETLRSPDIFTTLTSCGSQNR